MRCRVRWGLLIGLLVWLGVTGAAAAANSNEAVPAKSVDVLILTGQNNHNWQKTTPVLRSILESTGRFDVNTTRHPEQLTSKQLGGYDVVLSNWNTYGGSKNKVTSWPKPTRQAYINFVRDGGGHVVVHAGSSSFYKWKAYQRVSLAWWEPKQTSHGAPREFQLRLDAEDHPITTTMNAFTTPDELWRNPGVHPEAHVIASAYDRAAGEDGRWVPSAFVSRFGKGRCFTTLLGHGVRGMRNSGFKQLLRRGTAWAALGAAPTSEPETDAK